MARARQATRLAGRRLTSATLSTNERPRRGDVSRLTEANFRGEVDRLVHDCQPRRLVSPSLSLTPFLVSLRLPLSLSPSFLLPRRAPPSVSLARTYARTHSSRSVLSPTSSNLYFRLDRELGANWSKRARPPRFFNRPHGKLTASGYRRRRRVVHHRIYARRMCARAAPAVAERRRVSKFEYALAA